MPTWSPARARESWSPAGRRSLRCSGRTLPKDDTATRCERSHFICRGDATEGNDGEKSGAAAALTSGVVGGGHAWVHQALRGQAGSGDRHDWRGQRLAGLGAAYPLSVLQNTEQTGNLKLKKFKIICGICTIIHLWHSWCNTTSLKAEFFKTKILWV